MGVVKADGYSLERKHLDPAISRYCCYFRVVMIPLNGHGLFGAPSEMKLSRLKSFTFILNIKIALKQAKTNHNETVILLAFRIFAFEYKHFTDHHSDHGVSYWWSCVRDVVSALCIIAVVNLTAASQFI